jgi:hypothetical protein
VFGGVQLQYSNERKSLFNFLGYIFPASLCGFALRGTQFYESDRSGITHYEGLKRNATISIGFFENRAREIIVQMFETIQNAKT